MQRRQLLQWTTAAGGLKLAGGAAALGTLAGCATLAELPVEVRSFGEWPAGRRPGTYAFDRLPSQSAAAAGSLQAALEAAAASALRQAGFSPAAAGSEPELLVQLAARVDRSEPPLWDDPLWWHGGFGPWRRTPWRQPGWRSPGFTPLGWRVRPDNGRFDREVALLLRDRASGKPLYEAHASHEGFSAELDGVLVPLFAAALREFPAVNNARHTVRVADTPAR